MQLLEQKRKTRVLIIFGFTCLCFTALITRAFFLQIVQGPWLVERALSQWTRETAVSASRGTIYDRSGEVLAQSGSAYSVLLHPKAINTSENTAENTAACQNVAQELSGVLGMDEEKILEKAQDTTKYEIWLKRQITDEQSKQIQQLNLPGISLAADTKRYYPKGDFLTQVLGFTSIDGLGLEGLEKYYNEYLAGTTGSITTQTDEKGNEIAFAEQFYVPATNGYDLYLTVDYVIQSYAENAAQDAYERFGAKNVMCVVMDPKTGDILALTNKPGYDLNEVPRDDLELLTALTRNTSLADANDPGSVFKVFTLSAALDTGVAHTSDMFTCNGGRQLTSGFIKCASNHGTLSLSEGLAHSCNSVFIDLALRLGTERFYSYIEKFGFGAKTGIDFSSESTGIVISEQDVKEGDLARIGFGQSISVTPLQTITAFCAIINGGYLLEPHFLDKIVNEDGSVIRQTETTVVRQVISKSTSDTMRDLLKYVVTDGSGYLSAVEGYSVGGKTGTAQKYDENGKIKINANLSSYIAFAPVEDPQVAVLFLVDEPQLVNAYGSQVAAPYVGQILDQTLQYMGVAPIYTQEQLNEMGSVQVPDVIGMTGTEATTALEDKSLVVYCSGSGGKVVEQMPAAGEVVKRGETVAITIKAEDEMAPAEMVEVPDLHGKTIEECRQILEGLGLKFYSHGEGTAIWQNIKQGNEAEKGTQIRVEFSQ